MTVLKIDIDIPYDFFIKLMSGYFVARLEALKEYFGLKVKRVEFEESPSGNVHVYVELEEEVSEYNKIILQWLLGDDSARTYHNLCRLFSTGKSGNIFFLKKKREERVKGCEAEAVCMD